MNGLTGQSRAEVNVELDCITINLHFSKQGTTVSSQREIYDSMNLSIVADCPMLWTECLFPPQIHVKTAHNGMILRGLWEALGLKTIMNGISALLRVRREASALCTLRCKVQWEVGSLRLRKKILPRPNHAGTPISNFWPPELWEINLCCL